MITIREKKPLCPVTGEPLDPKNGLKFQSLFASNPYCVSLSGEKYYCIYSGDWLQRLFVRPCYVTELFCTTKGCRIFAAVKIIDYRRLTPLDTEALLQDLPINIVEQIASEHKVFIDVEHDRNVISMSKQFPIELDKFYSWKGILHLINEGILDICISSIPITYDLLLGYDPSSYHICRLTESAYKSHECTYGDSADKDLDRIFGDCTKMLEYRQKMITYIKERAEL